MKPLIFSTRNQNKIIEVSAKLGGWPIGSLNDIGCDVDIEETSYTLEGNARLKAHYIWDHYKQDVFADDTGLEIYALDNEPGVRSARYAGDGRNADDNMNLVLQKLDLLFARRARFRTAICLIVEGKEYMFEGIVEGHIAREKRGTTGFGYDPIFIPEGNSRSFAQMTIEEKNYISHRGRALQAMKEYLSLFIK
jgi:XTP/dITP diphosphohydrolase